MYPYGVWKWTPVNLNKIWCTNLIQAPWQLIICSCHIKEPCMRFSHSRNQEAHQQAFLFSSDNFWMCSQSFLPKVYSMLMRALWEVHFTKGNQCTLFTEFMTFCGRKGQALTHPATALRFYAACTLKCWLTCVPSSALSAVGGRGRPFHLDFSHPSSHVMNKWKWSSDTINYALRQLYWLRNMLSVCR